MPLYTYICDNCSNVLEIEHGIEEKIDQQCQHCLAKELKKIPSTVTLLKNIETTGENFKQNNKQIQLKEF